MGHILHAFNFILSPSPSYITLYFFFSYLFHRLYLDSSCYHYMVILPLYICSPHPVLCNAHPTFRFADDHAYEVEFIDVVNNVQSGCKNLHVSYGGKQYNLHQVHFHSPSEHTNSGEHYDGELHMVHYTDDMVGVLVFSPPNHSLQYARIQSSHAPFVFRTHPRHFHSYCPGDWHVASGGP